ncbi:Protein of unknown function [Pseudomonas sp. ok272]|uniref:DUF1120 domain-containing protein n=1 Tax=unclassified Pseudomonas TaxID=196821 RepID=UPI0008C6F954|nr:MULTISPECIES: DUF1120 domain-containing protein [unclassified Pseudomonas]SEM32273.1 Protein of unknown function [Pseudomonas sp. ok272]SFM32215.1 Protein of unknown function [Pseudomonas sp. ok602]
MNKTFYALTATALLATSTSALATSTVDLRVTGKIVLSSCTPSLSRNGVVDYGKISAKDLNQATPTALPEVTLQLAVDCDAPTLFSVSGADNRSGSASQPGAYGLGLINGNQQLGYYALYLNSAIADSLETNILQSVDEGITWGLLGEGTLPPAVWAGFGDQTGGKWSPKAIANLTTNLVVQGAIARADQLDLTDEQPIDGLATLEINYL